MKFIAILEVTKKFHKELLDIDPKDKVETSRKSYLVIGMLSDLMFDIRTHAAKGSGPRRKEWHAIIQDIAALSEDARHFEKNGKSAMPFSGVIGAYGAVEKKIDEMGDC
jgi:hypothetical protein